MSIYTSKTASGIGKQSSLIATKRELLPFFTQLNQNRQITNKVELIVNE